MNATSSSKPSLRRRRSSRSRVGAVTVEVALCLPVLLLFLFGAYELGRANMLLHATESAAYEGARIGILPGANNAKIEAACESILRSVGVQDFNVIVEPANLNNATEKVKVRVEVPFQNNTTIGTFFVDDPTFQGECELSREVL